MAERDLLLAEIAGDQKLAIGLHRLRALEIADRGYVLSHGEIVLHESAKAMQADRELLISSYLGEQQVSIGHAASTSQGTASESRELPIE